LFWSETSLFRRITTIRQHFDVLFEKNLLYRHDNSAFSTVPQHLSDGVVTDVDVVSPDDLMLGPG
jgi:hypothetical protein